MLSLSPIPIHLSILPFLALLPMASLFSVPLPLSLCRRARDLELVDVQLPHFLKAELALALAEVEEGELKGLAPGEG